MYIYFADELAFQLVKLGRMHAGNLLHKRVRARLELVGGFLVLVNEYAHVGLEDRHLDFVALCHGGLFRSIPFFRSFMGIRLVGECIHNTSLVIPHGPR